ncbi:hypothetical protein [Bacillus gaemokensis]|uniref:Uncharacterized protein n=1 Tax=Bacillus gaemokensis TaxID=574375 RepID=A0A073K4C8_9BACI|nr:hypothetical protein [Bacillus gaemokensis]KEK22154.1 hypothetical protein BAGA_20990 [Bacillus gaemokensis]KYG35591.1 hypothetical protein AZF08_26305 [Bacillus gaemokensis]
MLNVMLDEKVQVKSLGAKSRKNKGTKFIIPLSEAQYDQLEQLNLYDEEVSIIAGELIREGLEYAYMDDIPLHEYNQNVYELVSVEIPSGERRTLDILAKKHGCTMRKMGYTILNFMLKAQ